MKKKETVCVHGGTYHDHRVPGMNSPIFTSTSHGYVSGEKSIYPRYFNTPNQETVVRKLSSLEGAESGVLFSSGMAAISTAILAFAGNGDHVVLMDSLYGGTHSFATDDFARFGIDHTFAATDPAAVEQALTPATKVVVIESPTNPLMEIIDIRRVAEIARARGITTIIDNTFSTPINQSPLSMGIDVVLHSGTKYLGGHSDICCGVALSSQERVDRIRTLARHLGGSLNAATCYLLERSLKTLAIRVERQTENASRIAAFLDGHQAVIQVNYPGLPRFKGHEIARSQMSGFGGMLSFEMDAGIPPEKFLGRLKMIRKAVSLGGVDTIICSPAETSHVTMSATERLSLGITDSLLRFSAGIEHADDLIADLEQALAGGA